MIEIDNITIDLERRSRNLRTQEKEVLNWIHEAEEKERRLNEEIKLKAEEIYSESEEELNQRYKNKMNEYFGYWCAIGLYSIIVTFSMGYKEIAFRKDFQAFLGNLGTLLLNIIKSPLKGGEWTSQWTINLISNNILNSVVHSLFWFVGFICVIGLICFIGFFVIGVVFGGVIEQAEKRPRIYLFFNLIFILFLIVSAASIKEKTQFNVMYIYLIGNALWIAIIEIYKYYRN